MARKKTIFIIPGFNHSPKTLAYKKIALDFKKSGYFPILVEISWKKTLEENIEYFISEYQKVEAERKYILGFSFGAMIAFIASTKIDAEGLILCSLSPYFKEDLPKSSKNTPSGNFSKLKSARLAKKTRAKQILMLYGENEAKSLIKRVRETFDNVVSAEKYLIPVRKAEHSIGSRQYLYKINQTAKILN